MDRFSPEHVAQALAEALRPTLQRGEEAVVPGLGTFRVEHRASEMHQQPDGSLVVHPPEDVLTFEPEEEDAGPA